MPCRRQLTPGPPHSNRHQLQKKRTEEGVVENGVADGRGDVLDLGADGGDGGDRAHGTVRQEIERNEVMSEMQVQASGCEYMCSPAGVHCAHGT